MWRRRGEDERRRNHIWREYKVLRDKKRREIIYLDLVELDLVELDLVDDGMGALEEEEEEEDPDTAGSRRLGI